MMGKSVWGDEYLACSSGAGFTNVRREDMCFLKSGQYERKAKNAKSKNL